MNKPRSILFSFASGCFYHLLSVILMVVTGKPTSKITRGNICQGASTRTLFLTMRRYVSFQNLRVLPWQGWGLYGFALALLHPNHSPLYP